MKDSTNSKCILAPGRGYVQKVDAAVSAVIDRELRNSDGSRDATYLPCHISLTTLYCPIVSAIMPNTRYRFFCEILPQPKCS